MAISNMTNQAVDRFGRSGKVAWEYIGWTIDDTLGIDSNFKWVLGWLWSATQAPQKIIEWLRSGIDTSAELVWNIQAGWSNTTSASKALKMIVDPALSIISATPIPLAVNSVMTGLGLDKKASEWVGYLKSWLSETLQMLDVDKDTADELGSTLLDWAQVLLSIKWGQQSAKGTGSKWVQAIKDASRQAEIIKIIEQKAAARPGATPESIAATVARAKETVASAKTAPVSWWEVAAHNIKAYGYDVAANTAMPVLGMAIKWVKDGDYDSITNALEAFATNAAPTLATAIPWFKWVKAMKWKQTSLNLDEAPVKMDTTIDANKDLYDAALIASGKEPAVMKEQPAPIEPTISDKSPAYLRTGEFPSTQTMSESVPVQIALDRKLLWIDPTANPPKTPWEPTVTPEWEWFPNRTDRDISDMDAEKIVTQTVTNNLPTKRTATLWNWPIASAIRWAIGRAYDFVVSSRLWWDTLSVDVGWKRLPFTQFLDTTRRGIAWAIRNNITRSLKLNEQYAPLADSSVELKPEYLIGKSFPDFNGWKVIDADTAAKIIETQKYSDAHTKHSSNAYTENQRKNIYQNSSVYRFVKDDPALASQLFSPEQLVSLKNLSDKNKGNQNAISLWLTTANDSSGKNKYMSKSIMINPDYERISMSYENYQRFLRDNNLKDEDVISAVDTEWRTHTYNSALDFLSAYENKQKWVEFDPDQLASILKERWLDPQLDIYRDQWAAVSMDSFIDNVSRLVSNHETARMVDEAASSKDKTVSSYAKRLRSSPQFIEKALDVVPQRNTIEKWLDWVGKFVTPIRLLFNAKNYAQGMITSWVQNLMWATIARNKKWALAGFSPVQIKEYNDPLVADTLYNNGFTEKSTLEWEWLPDTWKWWTTKASQISAGAIQEHNGKAAIALREMDNFLKDNNIDTNWSPKDIVTKWNEFSEKKGNDPAFLKKKVDIKMQTELIGDFGKFSRFKWMGIGRYTKDLKNWTVWQVSSFMRDIGNLWDPQARKRLAIQMSPWVVATATAYAALPESEDRLEKALRIWSGIAFPPFGVYQLVQWSLGSSTVSAIKDVIAGWVKLGYIGMKDYSGDISDEQANKLYWEQLSRFTDAFGADKAMNVIYSVYNIGKELVTWEASTPYHEAKATTLGAPVDYKNITGAWYHKWKNITRATEDLMSAFVDMNYIHTQQNFENLERYKNDPTYTNKEPSITKGANIFQKILFGTSTPISDIAYALKESPIWWIVDDQYTMEKSVQQRIDGMHVIDILNDIDKSKTLEDIMVRQDIPVEAKNAMSIAIENMTTSLEWQNVKTKESIPDTNTTIYTPKSSLTDNFNGYINELKDNNPYAYNRIIGGIAQLSKSINTANLDGLNEYEKEQKINDLVTKAINPNNSGEQYIDAVIADRNNTKSLTTSYVNKVVDTISDMSWKKDGKEVSAEERMDLLNRLAGDIMNLSTNEYLIDSFGEAMAKLFTMENGRVKFLNGFFDKEALKDKMQNIIPFIVNGLQVRGEQAWQNIWLPVMPSQTQWSMNGSSSVVPTSSSISDILWLWTWWIKIKPLKLVQPKSQSGWKKIPSRWEAKSLAETLWIIKQQKSQPKVSQAKLATFSQK